MTVARLLSVTETLGAPRIFERSLKLGQGYTSDGRGLVSMDKRALYPGPLANLIDLCQGLGCDDIGALAPHLSAAKSVHFGADGDIGKCYLEFAPSDAPLENLVFLSLKWRGDDVRVSHYKSVTHLPHPDKINFIDEIVSEPVLSETLKRCLDIARNGDPDGEAVTLHVQEVGSKRASVDISIADAGRTIESMKPIIAPLFDAFGISLDPFIDAEADAKFGHIAAGIDRAGKDFATLYYGAVQI
jgi:hypothetical protein